jgi:hypothetical protein
MASRTEDPPLPSRARSGMRAVILWPRKDDPTPSISLVSCCAFLSSLFPVIPLEAMGCVQLMGLHCREYMRGSLENTTLCSTNMCIIVKVSLSSFTLVSVCFLDKMVGPWALPQCVMGREGSLFQGSSQRGTRQFCL